LSRNSFRYKVMFQMNQKGVRRAEEFYYSLATNYLK
jgi:hypothetical protein